MKKLVSIAVSSFLLIGCTGGGNSPKQKDALKPVGDRPVAKASAPKPKPHKAIIASYAVTPYTRDQYPKTFAKYGSRMQELEVYRLKAAETAARNPQCKKVDAAEVSSMKGSVNNMNFWVDCNMDTDMVRFRFTESQLDNQVAAVSEADKSWSKEQASDLCAGLIRQSVNFPSTLGINKFDYGFKTFEPLGNAKVWMNFKAKNAFDMELKYEAVCTFEPGNPNGEIQIKERASS
ncbi:hypothetical protein N8492_02295 [Synechococcus sp. AH-601-O06]|nr:hypothetical protein [Synechococcus sp. AH-601-O06]